MYSFFARHEVDKQAEGLALSGRKRLSRGNGRIAWALWGGDAGKVGPTKKETKLKQRWKKPGGCEDCEEKQELSAK